MSSKRAVIEENPSSTRAAEFLRENTGLLQYARERMSPMRTFGDFRSRSALTVGTRVLMSDSEIQRRSEAEWKPAFQYQNLSRFPPRKKIAQNSLCSGRAPRFINLRENEGLAHSASERVSPIRTFSDFHPRNTSAVGTRDLMSDSELQRRTEAECRRDCQDRNPSRSPPRKKSFFQSSFRSGRAPRYFDYRSPSRDQQTICHASNVFKNYRFQRNRSKRPSGHNKRVLLKSSRLNVSPLRGEKPKNQSNEARRSDSSFLKSNSKIFAKSINQHEEDLKKENERWNQRIESVFNLKNTLARIDRLSRVLRTTAFIFENLYNTVETMGEEVESIISASLAVSTLSLKEKKKLLEALLADKSEELSEEEDIDTEVEFISKKDEDVAKKLPSSNIDHNKRMQDYGGEDYIELK